ncbi:MAG: hypothetical protein WCY37_03845 [Candidatus Dojkabacteria bacterium]
MTEKKNEEEQEKQLKKRRVSKKELKQEIKGQVIPEEDRKATQEDYLQFAEDLFEDSELSKDVIESLFKESFKLIKTPDGFQSFVENIKDSLKGVQKIAEDFQLTMKDFQMPLEAYFQQVEKRNVLLKEKFEFYGVEFALNDIDRDIQLMQKVLDGDVRSESLLLKLYLQKAFYMHTFKYMKKIPDGERPYSEFISNLSKELPEIDLTELQDEKLKKKLKRLLAIYRRLFKELQKEPQAKMTMNIFNGLMHNEQKKKEDLEAAADLQKDVRKDVKRQYEKVLSEVMLSEKLHIYKKRVIQSLATILSNRNYSGKKNIVSFEEDALGGKVEVMTIKTTYKEIFEYAGARADSQGRFSGDEAKKLKEHLHELSGQLIPIFIQKGKYRKLYRQPLFVIYGDSLDSEGNTTISLQIFPSMYEGADNNFIQFAKNDLQELKELASSGKIRLEKLYDLCLYFKSYDNGVMKISEEKLAERSGLKNDFDRSKKKRVRENLKELLELSKKGEYISSYRKTKDIYIITLNPKKCKRINFKKAISEGNNKRKNKQK